MRRAAGLLVLGLIVAAGDGARAADGDGTAGGILARLPFGARSLALGGMHGALNDAPAAMTANPASLAAAGGAAVEAGLDQSAGDTRYGGLAAAYAPLPWLTAGVSYLSLSAGRIEAWDVVGTSYAADLQEDKLFGAAAAATWGPAAFGLGLRRYQSSVVGLATGSALFADLGARVRIALDPPAGWNPELTRDPNPNGVDLSAAVTGWGGAADYGGTADPGPLTIRLGAALGTALGRAGSVLLASVDTPRETARLRGAVGWEVRFPFDRVTVAARAGAGFRRGGGTFAAGLGAEFRGIALDYAFVSADAPFAATHHLTAGFHLDAFTRAARADAVRLDPLPDGEPASQGSAARRPAATPAPAAEPADAESGDGSDAPASPEAPAAPAAVNPGAGSAAPAAPPAP